MSEISESAKAIQEVAKAANEGIAASRHFGSFVARLIGEPLEIASGMISDRLRFARAERLSRLNTRFDELLKARGIASTRSIAPKFALPILEQASLENDDELQDLWASLLASAADPNFNGTLRSSFIDILKQLEVVDVHILHSIYDCYKEEALFGYGTAGYWERYVSDKSPTSVAVQSRELINKLPVDADVFENSIDNLVRLRCISSFVETKRVQAEGGRQLFQIYDDVSLDHGYGQVCMTALGVSFVEACSGRGKLSPQSS